jgi:hypothetical protein
MSGLERSSRWIAIATAAVVALVGVVLLTLGLTLSVERLANSFAGGASTAVTPAEAAGYLQRVRILGVGYLAMATVLLAARRPVARAVVQVAISAAAEWALVRGGLSSAFRSGELWGVAALTAVAAALRIPYLDDPMRFDEAVSSIYYLRRGPLYILLAYTTTNHILYNLLAWLGVTLFGFGPVSARLGCFLAGCLLVPLAYVAARAIWGRAPAVLGAALIAGWPYLVFLSVNARGYTLLLCCFMICLGLCPHLRRTNSPAGWILFAMAGALGLFTIPVMVYPLVGLAAWLLASAFLTKVEGVPPWCFLGRGVWAGVLNAALFVGLYTPGMIKNGLTAVVRNEMTTPVGWDVWFGSLPKLLTEHWSHAAAPLPSGLAIVFVVLLVLEATLPRNLRQIAPSPLPPVLTTVVGLLIVQRLLPAPRVFAYLDVLGLLVASAGVLRIVGWLTRSAPDRGLPRWGWGLAVVALASLAAAVMLGRAHDLDETGTCRDGRTIAAFFRTTPPEDGLLLGFLGDPVIDYYSLLDGPSSSRWKQPHAAGGATWLVVSESEDIETAGRAARVPQEIIPSFQEARRFPHGGRLFRYEGPPFQLVTQD